MTIELKPLTILMFTLQDQIRFWSHVQKARPDDCWFWLKTCIIRDGKKVPIFNFRNDGGQYHGYMAYASRVAYLFENGSIPNNKIVCHTCDNPMCMNPNHMWLGTNEENTEDRNQKDRQAKGSSQGSAKLTEEQILEIRQAYSLGETQQSIANRYKIDQRHVSRIVRKESWKHI